MADQSDQLATWASYSEGLMLDVGSFYSQVESTIKSRQIPDIVFKRVNLREGGMLSGSREYLRVIRADLRYDICGAPFGTGSFFSARLFSEHRFMDSAVSDMSKGGLLSQMAGAVTAKVVGVDTYYKLDTAHMFQQVVFKALTETIDNLTTKAQLPTLSEADRRPMLSGFFR
jgi:hypothetical protein